MITVEPLADPVLIDSILKSPEIAAKLRHDGREPGYIDHPAATYWGGWVDGELAGVFLAVRFSQWEIEVHAAILRAHIRVGRNLSRLFLARLFDDDRVERITGYVMSTLPTAANFCLRLGFHREGVRRCALKVGGELRDVLIYGLTRRDWEQACAVEGIPLNIER